MSVKVSWPQDAPTRDEFCARVREAGRRYYRDLPWRNIEDPYAVLVSEVMLQQTQVVRVKRFWSRFLTHFPTIDALAAADTAVVLEQWQGLGYNRRALMLKRAAEECALCYEGKLPCTTEELEKLPGIGPATAAGVVAFAFNRPATYLETNVRSVFIHELFPHEIQVKDSQLIPLVCQTCPQQDSRSWYYALLDYGAYLKATSSNPSRRSAHHSRQSAFEGSRRQKRAELLRIVLGAGSLGISLGEAAALLDEMERLCGRGGIEDSLFLSLVRDLEKEGFFHREGERLFP